MARKHTLLAKSRLLEYSEIQVSQIPVGTTVYEVSTLPSTVDETKVFIYVTSSEKYYRIKPKEPTQYDSSTADSGIMMGEPAVNMASGYEALFLHRYTSSGSGTQNDGLSVYKPITENIDLNSSSMYTPTAQAVSDFVVPKLDSTTYTTSTPSVTLHENTVYRCTNAGVTSITINISDMVTGPKTRESVVFFHTGSNPSPIVITGGNASTVVLGDTTLLENRDYWVSVKGNTVTITTNLADVAISGDYNNLLNKPDLDATLYESVTYSQLVAKISNSELVKGKKYRITDYVTTTRSEQLGGDNPDIDYYDYKSAKHPFDLVVTAISESTLDCMANAVLHDGDTYFEDSDLETWQIWYSVENNFNRRVWCDNNGKGLIYRMIDEYGNDCPYDFKNIQFKRNLTNDLLDVENGTLAWVYTFDFYGTDFSLSEWYCTNNTIAEYRYDDDGPNAYLNNIVMLGGFSRENNRFDTDCHDITIGRRSYNNTFGSNCSNIVFGEGCNENTIGCDCSEITLDDHCYNNTFGDDCYIITLSEYCINNTFGNGCSYISFGNNANQYGTYVRNVIIEKGVTYIRLYRSGTADGSHYLQNIYIAQGVEGVYSNYTDISTIARGLSYRTTVGKATNNTLRIYNEDDPVSASQVQSDWEEDDSSDPSYIQNKPTQLSDFTNDTGFITEEDLADPSEVAASALVEHEQRIEALEDKLDGDGNAQFLNLSVTRELYAENLSNVAYTGNYNDLTDKPTIPAAQVNSDWNAVSGVAQILNKPTITTVTFRHW